MSDTPETDELARSLLYERLASTETCYYEMRMLARQLEQDRDEKARLLGMSADRECDLRDELQRERALADRLAEELESLSWLLWGNERPNTTVTLLRHRLQQALAAWKEARND